MSTLEQVPENEELSVEAGLTPMLVVPHSVYLRTRVIRYSMGTGARGWVVMGHTVTNAKMWSGVGDFVDFVDFVS